MKFTILLPILFITIVASQRLKNATRKQTVKVSGNNPTKLPTVPSSIGKLQPKKTTAAPRNKPVEPKQEDHEYEEEEETKKPVTVKFRPYAGRNQPLTYPTPTKAGREDESAEFNWLATGKPRLNATPEHKHHPIELFEWHWHDVGIFFVFASFIVVAGMVKALFHRSHFLITHVPESCLMIGLGALVGGILYVSGVDSHHGGPVTVTPTPTPPVTSTVGTLALERWRSEDLPTSAPESSNINTLPVLTPRLFFNVLIPPVILESAYMLYDRAVLSNIYPILLHAFLGKFINVLSIGAMLLVAERQGWMGSLQQYGEPLTSNYSLSVPDAMLFSSVASGVDAAAVLHIFEENGVNKDLFFVMLGESLLNDAFTVTLSEYTAKLAANQTFEKEQYASVVLFLIILSIGGLVFGVLGGLVSALVTRVTYHCSEVEPLALLGLAYITYITAELIQFSGHLSILTCGLIQAHYSFKNISHSSYHTVKAVTKMIASTSESVIFLFLGVVLVNKYHSWHTGFFAWTVFLSIAVRLIVVVLLSELHGAFGGRRLMFSDQIVLSYCGIRGAVCFCLAQLADPTMVPARQLFITTLLALILFSTFIQGGTVKYVFDLLKVERSHWGHHGKSVVDEFHDQMCSMTTSGIEDIIGTPPNGGFPIYNFLHALDEKYLMKIFVRDAAHNSKNFSEYSNAFTLALLQHQLYLAVKDTKKEKQNSKILGSLPMVIKSLATKMGPHMLPMLNAFSDGRKRNSLHESLLKFTEMKIDEESPLNNDQNMVFEDVDNTETQDPPRPFVPTEQQVPEVPQYPQVPKYPQVPPETYHREFEMSSTPPPVYRDLKPKRPPSLIERVIEQVTKPKTPPDMRNEKKEMEKNRVLQIINEYPSPEEPKILNKNPVPAANPVPLEESSDTQYSQTFVLTRNSSRDDGSEPRDIVPDLHDHLEVLNNRRTSQPILIGSPPPLPTINVVTPSPNSTQGSRFPFPLRRKSSGRVIPLFRPGTPAMQSSARRRRSSNLDSVTATTDESLNTTAENLRKAVRNSAYTRMQYPGPHHDLQEDYERLSEAVLARHLQAIDDELQLVADVVSRSRIAIARIRARNSSLSTSPTGEFGHDFSRDLAPQYGAAPSSITPPPRGRTPGTSSSAPEALLRDYSVISNNDWQRVAYSSPVPNLLTRHLSLQMNSPPMIKNPIFTRNPHLNALPDYRVSLSPDSPINRFNSPDFSRVPYNPGGTRVPYNPGDWPQSYLRRPAFSTISEDPPAGDLNERQNNIQLGNSPLRNHWPVGQEQRVPNVANATRKTQVKPPPPPQRLLGKRKRITLENRPPWR